MPTWPIHTRLHQPPPYHSCQGATAAAPRPLPSRPPSSQCCRWCVRTQRVSTRTLNPQSAPPDLSHTSPHIHLQADCPTGKEGKRSGTWPHTYSGDFHHRLTCGLTVPSCYSDKRPLSDPPQPHHSQFQSPIQNPQVSQRSTPTPNLHTV